MDYKVPLPKQVSQDAGPGKFARAAGPAGKTLMSTELLQAAKLGDTFALSNLVSFADVGISKLTDQPETSSNDLVSSDSVVIPLTEPGTTKDNAFAVTACGNSILHIAARHGHYEFVEYVSKREPDLLTAENLALETPLHCCAKVGHNNIVSLIIDADQANVKHLEVILLARNVNGDTALHEAILNGHITVVKTLVEKGYSKLKRQEKNEEDKNYMDKKLKECIVNNAGATPLYLAVMQNSAEVVQLLLQQPLLFPSAPNLLSYYQGPNGKTALHVLLYNPMLVLKKDNSSNTPLHYVAASGDKKMVSVLLKKDASTGYASDKQQAGPIHVAARMGHVDVIREILEHCPDGHELVDRDGRSFLHVGVLNQKRSVVRYVLRTPGLESLLNRKDRSGDTALHLAVKMENKRVVYDLISDKRVQISPLNNIGYTPLDLADKLETGIRYILNNHYIITGCLAEMGAVFSPQILDCTATDTEESKGGVSSTATNYTGKKTSSENKTPKTESGDTETKSQMSLSKNLAILSALIATVAFGAGFTVPGGYRGDRAPGEGTAILTNKYSFRVFLISDTTALVCSLIATFWLMYGVAPKVDMKIRMRHLIWSLTLLWVSFSCIGMAFGMAAFAVVAPQSRHIGILVAAIAFVSPPITALVTTWPVISLLRTRIARLGCIEGMRGARMNQYTKWRIAERTKITTFSKIGDISVVLSVYALVLCLAKL